jgi:ammonia channel protein AmtB
MVMTTLMSAVGAATLALVLWAQGATAIAQTPAGESAGAAPTTVSATPAAAQALVVAQTNEAPSAIAPAAAPAAARPSINGADMVYFKARTGIDDSLDVFALHGVGGLVGTLLTPALATVAVAPITATVWTNAIGAMAVMAYAGAATWIILSLIGLVMNLRVDAESEKVGLDVAQHGEMLAPNA